MPAPVGLQDFAALLARQPGIGDRWRDHLIASPFGTIHAATFSFPRPIGTTIPDWPAYRLASLDTGVTGSISARAFVDQPPAEERRFPLINRTRKGNRLVVPEPDSPDIADTQTEAPAAAAVPTATPDAAAAERRDDASTPEMPPPGRYVVASAPAAPSGLTEERDLQAPATVAPAGPIVPETAAEPEVPPPTAAVEPDTIEAEPDTATPTLGDDVSPAIRTARIYFGSEPMAGMLSGGLQPWGPGEGVIYEDDSDWPPLPPKAKRVSVPKPSEATIAGGETIAGKGEVTGIGRFPKSPAARLGLTDKTRPRQEKCLADAIYFESRGEAARGQIAVAQVVMNRVFSGYYPDNVCGVVYQNAHRHLACQFTFACDGIPERVTEPDAWERAKTIAKDTLDGKYWLDDVGKATHYHAYWVHPWWVRTMRKLDRIGVHTFYRPRNWGDGADVPSWGDPVATKEAAKKL
jgi:spore germination cell wall hydrolase CwlJ-like protein